MTLVDRLLGSLAYDGTVVDVRVGLHWTAVAIEVSPDARSAERAISPRDAAPPAFPVAKTAIVAPIGAPRFRAGLAATQKAQNRDYGSPAVREAGRLIGKTGREVAALAASDSPTERSLGFAALNALLELDERACIDRNAEDLILERGAGRKVAIVGHFPFVPRAYAVAETCWVLELRPGPGDLPAERAPEIIPQADVVAITGMALVNGTFDALAVLPRPDAYVVVLGPSTPLSPLLFDCGVAAISGVAITDIPAALTAVSQGATVRQIPGKRFLTMGRDVEAAIRPL